MLLLQKPYTALLKFPSPEIEFWDPSIPFEECIAKETVRRRAVFMALTGPLPSERLAVHSAFVLHFTDNFGGEGGSYGE
jgi:hypothetical protein